MCENYRYTWTDYKTNTQITKELKITPILDKLLEYKRNWIQHVNRMPRNRLPRVMKHYSATGRRSYGRSFEETSAEMKYMRIIHFGQITKQIHKLQRN